VASRVEIGAGWSDAGQVKGQDYVGLNLAHPDIGPRTFTAKPGRAAGQDDDVFALIWNLRGLTGPPPRRQARGPPPAPAPPSRPVMVPTPESAGT
jgi:hypothetical protein